MSWMGLSLFATALCERDNKSQAGQKSVVHRGSMLKNRCSLARSIPQQVTDDNPIVSFSRCVTGMVHGIEHVVTSSTHDTNTDTHTVEVGLMDR